MISFGLVQIVFSQIPDFDQLWWLSILAAVMSFTYSTIGLGLGIGKVIGIYNNFTHMFYYNNFFAFITYIWTKK
jgi:hypothetical protein